MERLLADTGYWIALLNPRVELHEKAVAAAREFISGQIVTSQMVLTEFLNCFGESGARLRQAGARAAAALMESSQVDVYPQTSELFHKSLKRYREMADKNWSLTDCSSFLIMAEEKITGALTHDRHFTQAGFRALLR